MTGQVHFTAIQQAQTAEVVIVDQLCKVEALAEVAVSVVPPLQIRADHPEVVIGDGRAAVVAETPTGFQRAGIVCRRPVEIALDVRKHAQVLLDPAANEVVLSAQLERPGVRAPSRLQLAALQLEPGQCVERLRGRSRVAESKGRPIAALAELLRGVGFALPVADESELSQYLGDQLALAVGLGRRDGRQVAVRRFGKTTLPVVLERLVVQRLCVGRCRGCFRPRGGLGRLAEGIAGCGPGFDATHDRCPAPWFADYSAGSPSLAERTRSPQRVQLLYLTGRRFFESNPGATSGRTARDVVQLAV